jgi:pyruvate dehydrogenase kinase 2/3/4
MAMKLKSKGAGPGDAKKGREVSARRQVGDAENMVNPTTTETPWWRQIGMEEGI